MKKVRGSLSIKRNEINVVEILYREGQKCVGIAFQKDRGGLIFVGIIRHGLQTENSSEDFEISEEIKEEARRLAQNISRIGVIEMTSSTDRPLSSDEIPPEWKAIAEARGERLH